jgi:hypothetical protein
VEQILIKFAVILGCILSFSNFGNAQSVFKTEFKVPFDFIVKEKVFPAGKYSIERLNGSNPNFLLLQNTDGSEKTVFLLQNSSEKNLEKPFLTFVRRDEKYFLESIKTSSNNNKQRILLTVLPKPNGKI